MVDQERQGIIEEVSDNQTGPVGRTYFMPHLMVIRDDKETTKLRIVFHASSKMSGEVSLNECLEIGDTFYTDLLGVLIRFWFNRIALLADIEKAFLQIGIKEEDRDALRFLWVRDVTSEELVTRQMRFTRVCFGVISSMGHLGGTIHHHLDKHKDSQPEVVIKIEDALYADDFSGGEDDDRKAIKLYKGAKKIFEEANMNLRKWKSNSLAVTKIIEESNSNNSETTSSYAQMMLNPDGKSNVKVLGIPWHLENDELEFSLENLVEMVESDDLSKRQLLKLTASLYDPLGMISPVILTLKALFQKVCKVGTSWDEPLNQECREEWKRWLRSARSCPTFKVPRCYSLKSRKEIMLVGFSDASEKAYAAAVYIRIGDSEGTEVSTCLVASKTRVAPLAKQSIPRLELLGALILARLINRVKDILVNVATVGREICLVDSAVVLCWIQGVGKVYKQYVQNRVEEIRKITAIDSWNHVAGEENVADIPSRGCLPEKLSMEKERWFNGPDWLKKCIEAWPIKKSVELHVKDNEEKENCEKITSSCTVVADISLENIIDPQKYSSLNKLLRVNVFCLRFIEATRGKRFVGEDLCAEEIENA